MDDSQDIFILEQDFRRRYEYTPSDLLGEGGFAQVYKAYDKQFSEFVALKFYSKGEKGKYDVLHEMKDSRGFSHKNIIRVHDAFVVRFEHAGTYSFVQVGVLEYANGGNLRDFIETKPTEDKFIKVLTGILEGLKYLHSEKGIIHRDLSPENILMYVEGDKWVPKISDFGISKKLEHDSITIVNKKSTQLLGKIDYMAPEQFYPEKFGIDGTLNTNVDLWAFGIIMYELFMHKTPFGDKNNDNPIGSIQSITNGHVSDIEDIPNPYRKVIERCLVKEARKRVRNPEELISILTSKERQFLGESRNTIPIKEFKNKVVNLKWAGFLLGVIAFIFGGYFVVNGLIRTTINKSEIEIDNLMKDKKYSSALVKLNKLPGKTKNTPSISKLVKQCRIQIAEDSIGVLIQENQFSKAVKYFEKLPADIKSDSALLLLYNQSTISLVKKTFGIFIGNKDFVEGFKYFKELGDQVKKNPEIVRLYKELLLSSAIDSLMREGKSSYDDRNYEKARRYYKLVLFKYDSKNRVADSMIKKIDVLTSSPNIDKNINPAAEVNRQRYSVNNLKVGQSPDPGEIVLSSIVLADTKMVITLEIQPLKDKVTIYNPNVPSKAFYIESGDGSQQLTLKDVRGVVTNTPLSILKPTKVELEFDRLPKNVKIFNLIEGKNQKDSNQHPWNFKSIRFL